MYQSSNKEKDTKKTNYAEKKYQRRAELVLLALSGLLHCTFVTLMFNVLLLWYPLHALCMENPFFCFNPSSDDQCVPYVRGF